MYKTASYIQNDPINMFGRPCICGSWPMRPLTVKDGVDADVFPVLGLIVGGKHVSANGFSIRHIRSS